MRIRELSEASGVPVATIKFYIREKLLPPGELLKANQAEYGDEHLRRLRMIKGLVDVAGLKIADAARVLAAIDSELDLAEAFGVAQEAVSDEVPDAELTPEAFARVDAVTAGWHVSPGNPGRRSAARVAALCDQGVMSDERGWFGRYAAAALLVAEADLDEIEARPDRDEKVETVVVGTALGDTLFAALRRAAQEHVAAQRYGR
jgi:DNA-binding transcriptional MerR regulator